jgi:hypothetical protein
MADVGVEANPPESGKRQDPRRRTDRWGCALVLISAIATGGPADVRSAAIASCYDSLALAYRELPRRQVEQVVRGVFGEGTDIDSAEGFLDDLDYALGNTGRAVGKVATQPAPVLAQVAPGVTSGVRNHARAPHSGWFGSL